MRMKMKYLLLFMMVAFAANLKAQQTYTSTQALEIFKSGDYEQAEKAYAYLLSKYDREPKYNYYYGICLLQVNKDLSEAVKRLKYATIKGVSRDAYYYLGRAYQLTYNFDEAIFHYDRFLKYASASDIRNDKAEVYKKECETGKSYSAKVYDLSVLSRDTVLKNDFLKRYHPVKDVGTIMRNADFFESGVDPEGVLYLTERGDEVYFAMKEEDGQRNLYKMEKLLDGWGDAKPLTDINTEVDDVYPFLMIDGETLYFSSDREGSLGGLDIYRCVYDSETKTFTNPVNMGIPFNSPKDDYLFVADDFNKVAWFASNRETPDSLVMVYGIKWDATVVKSLVTDMNIVKEKAALPLSAEDLEDPSRMPEQTSSNKVKQEKGFRFVVADTLIYTQLSHFRSSYARAYFEDAQQLTFQKDSLSHLMHGKRNSYAKATVESERTELVNEILKLEKQVYGLDGKIELRLNEARSTEIERIKELIKQGRYITPTSIERKEPKEDSIELKNVDIPSGYSYYTNEEFEREMKELEPMYESLFNAYEIEQLKGADSMYVWGHILSLESSRLLEQANTEPSADEHVFVSPFKKKDSTEIEQLSRESLVEQSKGLKEVSLKAYHSSLDTKYKLYSRKISKLVKQQPTADMSYLEDPLAQSNNYFRKADELMNPMMGYNIEKIERAGTLKRTGVQTQEGALLAYIGNEGKDKVEVVTPKPVSKAPKTYQEWQGYEVNEELKEKLTVPVVSSPEPKKAEVKSADSKYEYRIQIGVFRNAPNAEALEKIPAVTKNEIPSNGLTKYFAGSYSNYADAAKDLNTVRSAGFSGAFIVVFEEGKQINLTDDLKK